MRTDHFAHYPPLRLTNEFSNYEKKNRSNDWSETGLLAAIIGVRLVVFLITGKIGIFMQGVSNIFT